MENSAQRFISQHFLAVVLILQVAMYLSLFLNYPLARMAVGLVYLTFVPGLVLIKLLKLNELGTLEVIVFSVGFSIAFLMLAGLVINQFGYVFGINFPLSTLPLSLFINTLIIIGAALAHLRQGKIKQQTGNLRDRFNPVLLLLALLPILSVIGTYLVNVTENNSVLIVMLVAVAGLFGASMFYHKSIPKFYAFAIFMIALALLWQTSLVSNYVVPNGGDSPAEFYVFQLAQSNGHWNPTFAFADENLGRFNAMLSITVLPTVYSSMLGMDPTMIFKIVYPVIFALVPVALYLLWQPYIGKKLSFAAAFLFMAQSTFFTEMVALDRQMIGELFFVLLLLVLLSKNVRKEGKFVGFAILGIGLVFSHYALAEIFLFLIFAAWAVSTFYFKKPSFNLQFSTIIFFFVAMFVWYIYTSGAVVFDSFLTFISYVTSQLGGFLNPASRGQTVLAGIGLAESPSVLNTISRVFAYATEIFIVIGIIALLKKKTPFRFDRDFTVFSLVTVLLLVLLTVVPGLANTLSMTRFYHILLMILAPFCVIGMWYLTKFLLRHEKQVVVSMLVVAVLVPYFLFQTNFVYEVAKTDSWSIPLSGYRMDPMRLYGSLGYIDTYSVYGAEWVGGNVPYQYNLVADNALYTALTAYGLVYRGYAIPLRNDTVLNSGQFVYLSYISINYEQQSSNSTLPQILNKTDVVYSNGGSEINYKP